MSSLVKRLQKCLEKARLHLSEQQVTDLLVKHAEALAQLDIDTLSVVMAGMTVQEIASLCKVNKTLAEKCRDEKISKLYRVEKEWRETVTNIMSAYDNEEDGIYDEVNDFLFDNMYNQDSVSDIATAIEKSFTKDKLVGLANKTINEHVPMHVWEKLDGHSLAEAIASALRHAEDDYNIPKKARSLFIELRFIKLPKEKREKWIRLWKDFQEPDEDRDENKWRKYVDMTLFPYVSDIYVHHSDALLNLVRKLGGYNKLSVPFFYSIYGDQRWVQAVEQSETESKTWKIYVDNILWPYISSGGKMNKRLKALVNNLSDISKNELYNIDDKQQEMWIWQTNRSRFTYPLEVKEESDDESDESNEPDWIKRNKLKSKKEQD